MDYLANLITDRTPTDTNDLCALLDKIKKGIATAEDLQRMNIESKGAYTHTDWNRVEAAVAWLSAQLNSWIAEMRAFSDDYGVVLDAQYYADPAIGAVSTRTNWQDGDLPDEAELDRYLGNVWTCNSTLQVPAPDLPETMRLLGVAGANAIEQLLLDVWTALEDKTEQSKIDIQNTASAFWTSGEITAGEDLIFFLPEETWYAGEICCDDV